MKKVIVLSAVLASSLFAASGADLIKAAKDAVTQALSDSYVGRRDKKGNMRSLWIARLNAACREEGITYSRFIEGLNKANVKINRKALSNMAIEDRAAFKEVVAVAKKAIGA